MKDMKQILRYSAASLAALLFWAASGNAQDESVNMTEDALDTEVTAAVSKIDGEALNERTSSYNILQNMAGKAAGVKIVSTSGRPGGNPMILIRGISSINGNSAPLYVVDGIVDVDPQVINSYDIESISILKDAAATAIYGTRGGNGVVVITTKSGKGADGRGTVTYDGRYGVGYLGTTVNMMNAQEYMSMMKQAYAYSNTTMPQNAALMENLFAYTGGDLSTATPLYDTDWWKESTRKAITQNHNVSFSHSTETSKVFANIGWQNVEGVLKETYADRLSGTINASAQVKPWLDIRGLVSFSRTSANRPDNEGSAKQNALRAMYEMPSIIPVKYSDNSWGKMSDFPGSGEGSNPVEQLSELKNNDLNQSVIGNIGLDFKILPQLTLTVNGNIQDAQFKNTDFTPEDIYDFASDETGTQAFITYANSRKYANDNFLTYKYESDLGNYAAEIVLGTGIAAYVNDWNTLGAQKMSTTLFEHYNLGAGTQKVMPVSDYTCRILHSYYLNTTQSFGGKVFVNASLRYEGGTGFESLNKYEIYPAVSAAWLISEEPIFDGIKDKVSLLKLRAGVGRSGNMANGAAFWENSCGFDAGLDAGFFGNRVMLSANVYSKFTSAYPTFANTIRNKGLELTLNATPVLAGDFRWDLSMMYYTNKATVGKYYTSTVDHGTYLPLEGDLGRWYMDEFQGVWGSSEAGEAAAAGSAAGDYKIGSAKYFGKVMPKGDVSFVNSFSWKGLSLMVDVAAAWGFQVANMTKGILVSQAAKYNTYANVLGATWTPSNQNSAIAQLRLPTDSGFSDGELGSYVLEDGDFIRVRNIMLSYEFPKALMAKTKVIKGLAIGASIENPVLWTKYNGIDPEAGFGQSYLNYGYDIFSYPRPTTVSGHIKLSF